MSSDNMILKCRYGKDKFLVVHTYLSGFPASIDNLFQQVSKGQGNLILQSWLPTDVKWFKIFEGKNGEDQADAYARHLWKVLRENQEPLEYDIWNYVGDVDEVIELLEPYKQFISLEAQNMLCGSDPHFHLVIVRTPGNHKLQPDGYKLYKTQGLLSSIGGADAIMSLLGMDCIVDIGDSVTPIVFKMKDNDVEPLRQLLEANLQSPGFDRDESSLVEINYWKK